MRHSEATTEEVTQSLKSKKKQSEPRSQSSASSSSSDDVEDNFSSPGSVTIDEKGIPNKFKQCVGEMDLEDEIDCVLNDNWERNFSMEDLIRGYELTKQDL